MRRWPVNSNYFWREAPFFRLLMALILAIIFYDRNWLPNTSGFYCCIGSMMFFLLLVVFRKAWKGYNILLFFALQIVMFCLGWYRMQDADVRTNPRWFGRRIDTSTILLVKILDAPAEKNRTWKLRVGALKSIHNSGIKEASGEAFLSIYKNDSAFNFQKGDLVIIPSHWQTISNSGNPFEYDYVKACHRRNIYYQQFASINDVQLLKRPDKNARSFLENIHDYCQESLDKYLTDTAAKGLMQAMLLGDESSFDPALRQAYADTGVIHIVSISGSHVAVLFLIITSLLFWLKGRHGNIIKYLLGLCIVWLYVLMAGAPPSAVRSATMFSIIALGTLLSKDPHPLNTLLGAAFALLCSNPNWLFSVGFQLSFAAVLSLLLFYRPLYRSWPQTTFIGKKLWQAVAASIAAEILIAPLGIYYFHNFPLFFFVANVPAAILLGMLALAGGISLIAFSKITWLAKAIAFFVTWLVRVFNYFILILQSWNPGSFKYLQLSWQEVLVLYFVIVMFAVALLQQKRKTLLIGLSAASLLMILLIIDKYHVLHQNKLIAYNLGRNMRVERIQGNTYRVLYADTGAKDNYLIKGSHTGFQAWRRDAQNADNYYFSFRGKRILTLRDDISISDATVLPVDILIVARPLKGISLSQLQEVFHPQKIVIASGQPRYLLERWKDSCEKTQISLHGVGINGAFVLD